MTRELVRNLIELLGVRSDTIEGKKALLELVRARSEDLGLDIAIGGNRDSPAMLASNGIGGIAFAAHLDTVPAGDGWTREDGEVEAGRV